MLFVRSLCFASVHVVSIVPFALIGMFLWPFPFTWRYKVIVKWALLNLWLLNKICGVSYQVEKSETIPSQPCIVMCKHQSAWETLALQAIFPPQTWILKRELLWLPFFGWGLAALKPVAINRNAGKNALAQIIDQGHNRLLSGIWVVIFPEGTRVPSGKIGRFAIGAAALAVQSGYPVVPVAHNAGTVWPKHQFIKKPGIIKLVVGRKIATKDKTIAEVNCEVYQWMETQMTQLEGNKPTEFVRQKSHS